MPVVAILLDLVSPVLDQWLKGLTDLVRLIMCKNYAPSCVADIGWYNLPRQCFTRLRSEPLSQTPTVSFGVDD
ncbi:hypothetical protein GCM10009712_33810 [Pseudarthrobacter sulfonivorans]